MYFLLYAGRRQEVTGEDEVAELRTRTYLLKVCTQQACNSLYGVHLLLLTCTCTETHRNLQEREEIEDDFLRVQRRTFIE